jgi:DNA-binding GntR family transcriptional regulator
MASENRGPVVFRTAHAAVAEMLRREVLSGDILPGTRLRQSEVAARYETSTTPVREAMRQLVSEGLLDSDPHKGVIVHAISLDELEEIYDLRLLLEPQAVGAAVAKITTEDLAEAGRLADAMELVDHPAAWSELNARFHALLTETGQRPRLAAILSNLRNLSAMYVARSIHDIPDRVRTGNAEHRQLLEAFAVGDVAMAQEIERAHLRHTLEIGKQQLART